MANVEKGVKRYFWLKFKEDFFKQREIKIIEGMPNGAKYLIFYQKLLCESIATGGCLRFNDATPYSNQMLAALTNTDIDVVLTAMRILTDLGLIETWAEGTIHMTGAELLIGSESESAERTRQYRQRKQQAMLNPPQGQLLQPSQCDEKVSHCNNIVTEGAETQTVVTLPLQSDGQPSQCDVDIRYKRLDNREYMTEQERVITCSETGAHTHAHTPTHEIITYSNNDILVCVQEFVQKILRLDRIKNLVDVMGDEWAEFYAEFEKVMFHPYSNMNLLDLQRANSEALSILFDRVSGIHFGARKYHTYKEIEDLSKYTWTTFAKVVKERRPLICELDMAELTIKLGKQDFEFYLARVQELQKRNPTAVFNIKYAIYQWHKEDAKELQSDPRDKMHSIEHREIPDEELLQMFNPFWGVMFASDK